MVVVVTAFDFCIGHICLYYGRFFILLLSPTIHSMCNVKGNTRHVNDNGFKQKQSNNNEKNYILTTNHIVWTCLSVRVCVMVCAYTIQTFTNRIDQAPNKRTMKAKLRSNGWTTTSTMHTISHLHLFSCYIIRLFVFIYLFVYFMLLDFCFFSSYFLPCHFITSLPSGLSVSTYCNIYSYNTISVQYNLYVYDAYSIFIPLWNRSVHLKHCVCMSEWVHF